MDRWKRIALTVRILASLVLAGVLAFVLYQLYDFYRGRLGNSPTRVTQDYFQALGDGDFERAYMLTDPASLTGLYGRRATKSDVFQSYQQVTGGASRQFTSIMVTRLARRGDGQYMQVMLSGPAGVKARVVVEISLQEGVWRITHPFGLAP